MSYQSHESTRTEQLLELELARQALTQASTVQHAKAVRQKAESIRSCAQRIGLGIEVQNFAAELKLQAERLGGQLLSGLRLRGGDRNREGTPKRPLRLKDLGIDKNQSARWQMEAAVPETLFREFVREAHHAGREISSAGLIRIARELRESEAPQSNMVDDELPTVPVATHSHLLDSSANAIPPMVEFDEITGIVTETRNHHQLLMNLVRSACDRAVLACDSTDYRAINRYLDEVDRSLAELAQTVNELARAFRFGGGDLSRGPIAEAKVACISQNL